MTEVEIHRIIEIVMEHLDDAGVELNISDDYIHLVTDLAIEEVKNLA